MTSKIRKLLDKLEDPKMPFLGPTTKWLEIWGLMLPESFKKKIMYFIIHGIMFLFISTEYIDLWTVRSDMKVLFQNMKYTIISNINVSKVITFLIWQKKWKSIIEFICEVDLDRRKSKDQDSQRIIKKFTKYSRTITILYWFLTYSTVLMTVVQPLVRYIILYIYTGKMMSEGDEFVQVVNSWFPFGEGTLSGYLMKLSFQVMVTIYSGGWITSFDTNAFSIMIFFRCELELLRRDGQLLFGTDDNPCTRDEAQIRLAKCHKRHDDFLKYTRLFDSCLAPIMFLYVIVCSVMLCATAYQLTFETSAMQRFITAEYLIFGVAQLFMYCWHSNDVLFASRDLTLGPYESIWWTRELSEQRNVNILVDQFSRIVMFGAGPFTDITVATFISILKGAYSYYTLLSQSQQD